MFLFFKLISRTLLGAPPPILSSTSTLGAAPSDAMPIVLGTALEARCGSGVTGGGSGVRSSTDGRVSAAVSKARSASDLESVWIVILKQEVLDYVHYLPVYLI